MTGRHTTKSKSARRAARLYRASKISDYQFKKVLWFFACDLTAAQASRQMNLSENAIAAIYRKLRVFFTEVGLFQDFYHGVSPEKDDDSPNAGYEVMLLEYHFERLSAKRGLTTGPDEIDYDLRETYWRSTYHMLGQGRDMSDTMREAMYQHLVAIIRACGPVGGPPRNPEGGVKLIGQQLDEKIRWLERFSPLFRDEESRANLKRIREL